VAAEFVRHFPSQRFVLDHLAKPPIKSGSLQPWAHGLRELAAFPNVWCKLSGLVTEADWQQWKPEQLAPYIAVAFDCFGPERLMIGSDWPVCTVAASYTRAMDVVKNYLSGQPAQVQAAVLGGNAQRFWKLKP
jgi:L-fuconolactonase